jgi:hypothetical protein
MSEENETETAKKLDHKVDYLDRIEELEKEVKRMTDQAADFRDLALSHADLLRRAATVLEERCHPRTHEESKLIAELHEAAKDG